MESKTIVPAENRSELLREIKDISGEDINTCYQCYACASVCPFKEYMDFAPHQLFRLCQYGLKEEVLKSNAIWICVGCHTCSSQCPASINIVEVMDAFRQLSVKHGLVSEEDIKNFHDALVRSIYKHGRTHKLGIMLSYKLKSGGWFEDIDVGLEMLRKRKLDLLPHKIRDLGLVKELFSNETPY